MMDTDKRFACLAVSIFLFTSLLLAGCANKTGPGPVQFATPAQTALTATANPGSPSVASPTPACSNSLSFLYDITIPDGTSVAPGSALDKQWLVQNSASCNWDVRYSLRLISGNPMGASTQQALYPARSGTQANIRILFTAPQEAGDYTSEWQAFDPDGVPFGESFFIKVTVSP
jgi:hypothetical protein